LRVLVIGSTGQLGSDVVRIFADGDVIGLDHQAIDIEIPSSIANALAHYRPDFVVNAAAFHNVELCESRPDRAFSVNALAVDDLARQCALAKIHLIHVSTDYVFDGRARVPYDEHSPVGPLSVYAISKVAGEQLLQRHGGPWTIVRTSGLYGIRGSSTKGHTFIERVLTQAAEGRPLHVVNDMTFSPSYTRHVAQGIRRIIESRADGIFHVTNAGHCTWYEFAREVFRQSGVQAELHETTSERFPTVAKRPAFSALAHGAFERAGLAPMPPWQEGVRDYLLERSLSAPPRD
jgi:dTDP-4-dehydrorhamnose reductase